MTFDSRQEFLDSRRGKLGASDAPIIMGVSPWSTPYQLWRKKLDLDPPTEMKPHMQRGLDIENEARDYFYTQTGIKVSPIQVKHKDISYMIASLDGLSNCGQVILEIKCPSYEDHIFVKNNNAPPKKYWPQLQHQISCQNPKEAYYLSYYKADPILLTVKRDQAYIDNLLGKEAEFFNCLKELIAPELIEQDYIVRTDTEWVKYCGEFREYQRQIKDLESKMEKAKKKIVDLSDGKNCTGEGVSTCKVFRRGNINYNIIPYLQGIDLEPYRKESSYYWKVNVDK